MTDIISLFPTRVLRTVIEDEGLRAAIETDCAQIATDDRAGQRWSARNGYPGYTSYASLDDLPKRSAAIAKLVRRIDAQVAVFARELAYDLGRGKLVLDAIWINVLEPGGFHTGHIHPNAVVSGTYYVAVPDGASALKLEDPRLPMMMARPPIKAKGERPFVALVPAPGTLLLWESFLRHEVPLNAADGERISVSFNYAWV